MFSVQLHGWSGHSREGEYIKCEDFDQAIYYVNWRDETGKVYQESIAAFEAHRLDLILKHPKILKYVAENDVSNYEGNLAWDVLGKDEFVRRLHQSQAASPMKADNFNTKLV